MRSHFNFKSLFKRLPNVSIPKEFIYFGIGAVLVVLLGLIASNMYLQEMLFFEGIEKSVQLFTEEELREYGELYKSLEIDFQNSIARFIQDYANRTNRKGEKIKWGVYGQNNTEDLLNTDFVDGVSIKYAKTKGRNDGESNFTDIITAVSIAVDQKQSRDEIKIRELITELFKMSHTFTGKSTDLYPCTHGCFCDFYHCSDAEDTPIWDHCNIKYQPFAIKPHSEYDDYFEEDFEIVDMIGRCEVDNAIAGMPCYEQRGCVQEGVCYHGSGGAGSKSEDGNMGRSMPTPESCSNWRCHPDCSPPPNADEHDCGVGEPILDGEENQVIAWNGEPLVNLGCAGYYECKGHLHYHCPNGHFYVCCMGHTNVTINIKIMYIDEILDVIKKGYSEE